MSDNIQLPEQSPTEAAPPLDVPAGSAYRGSDGAVTCCECDFECEWEECQSCGGDGGFDGYDEDPNYYHPGETITCTECGGRGGFWYCGNHDCKTHFISRVFKQRPNDAHEPTRRTDAR